MSLTSETMTPADIAAVTGNNGGGFGGWGEGSWFIIILFLFAFLGWGGRGFGTGGGGDASGAQPNYVLVSDFAQLERKLDTVNAGLCDGFYAQNSTMLNGFAGVNQNLANGFANAELARTNGNTALMQQMFGMSTQLADCCCQARYDSLQNTNTLQNAINTGFCQTNYNAATNTRDIVDNANANTRAILDALTANKVEALRDRIAEQNQQITALNLARSQSEQNAYLIDQLGTKCPIPAYLTCNPNAPLNYSVNYGGGCGCNG